eukprot:4037714-Pyramimonas_sp.AAC.1
MQSNGLRMSPATAQLMPKSPHQCVRLLLRHRAALKYVFQALQSTRPCRAKIIQILYIIQARDDEARDIQRILSQFFGEETRQAPPVFPHAAMIRLSEGIRQRSP